MKKTIPKTPRFRIQPGSFLCEPNPSYKPNSSDVQIFQPFNVKLLKALKGYDYKKGDIVQAELIPNNLIYLLNTNNEIIHTGAKEGVDFEII